MTGKTEKGGELEPLLTREQAAEILQSSVSFVKAQIRAGKLAHSKMGKLVRIDPADLRTFIESHRSPVVETVGTPSILFPSGPDSRISEVSEKIGGAW